MDENESNNRRYVNVSFDNDSKSAVNSLILDYYQKFGRKRDLEQFFSLSTAQSDIKDPTSSFWRKMKIQEDSSDSGEGKAESSTELCRISIKCTLPESSTSQDEQPISKDESESPPIIIEEPVLPLQAGQDSPSHTDNESLKSDDNNSQKSTDAHLDVSTTKLFSPTSSINSQRKLEWDSLGDVGYGNESERKASGSSLSTLERLALHQQYSNNDSKNTQYGTPTCHSTPVEPIPNIWKRSNIKKTTKIHRKDIDIVELNVPQSSDLNSGGINVNLTKHISFNVHKDGDITVGKSQEDNNFFPNKISVETEMTPQIGIDKEIQTSVLHNKPHQGQSTAPILMKGSRQLGDQKFPILISLNSLKKRTRRNKFRHLKKKVCYKAKRKTNSPKVAPEKSGSQISKAESFEYMPGHMYSQNQMQNNNTKDSNSVGNKSSLESTVFFTTDSSKSSKNSFTKDLEKSIDLLKKALHPKYDNENLKEKLIKEVVQRLLTTKYGDDDNANAFLSGLGYKNKKMGIPDSVPTTTSTSEGNNDEKSDVIKRPKKSILRMDKFNPSGMASTSQSTPNLHTLALNESNALKTSTSTADSRSDFSSRERNSSDTITKLSSEELYTKYLEALKREKVHKKLLKDKEALLKSKLVNSDSCIKTVPETCDKSRERLYKLIKDLARNNVNDGSGDGYKVESNSDVNKNKVDHIPKQKSHSVFTLTSGKSIRNTKFSKIRTSQSLRQNPEAGSSHATNNCCCNSNISSNSKAEKEKVLVHGSINYEQENKSQKNCHFDSMRDTKVDMPICKQHVSNESSPQGVENIVTDITSDVQYVCLCPNEAKQVQDIPEKLLIYKCSRISKHGICLADTISKESTSIGIQCSNDCLCGKQVNNIKLPTDSYDKKISPNENLQCAQSSNSIIYPTRKASTSSQTNANLNLILRRDFHTGSDTSISSTERNKRGIFVNKDVEITQSVQTKISIDPKILDPTLSDVKLVKDLDCVRLGCRELEKYKNAPSEILIDEDVTNQASKCNEPHSSVRAHEDQGGTCCDSNFLSDIKNSNVLAQDARFEDPQIKHDKFSIPIQGTNMTLVVSLGSKTGNDNELGKNVEKTEDSVKDQRLPMDRHIESYSKAVQCKSTDIFIPINSGNKQQDMKQIFTKSTNTCNWGNEYDGTIDENVSTKPTTYVNENFKKYNTYPKKVTIAKKPFLRSNTDTDRLEAICTSINNKAQINVDTQKHYKLDACKVKNVTEATKNIQEPSKNCDTQEKVDANVYRCDLKTSSAGSRSGTDDDVSSDPLLNIIQDITKRYTKKDIESSKRKKCFKEIINVLNYLLDTEESSERNEDVSSNSKSNTCAIDQSCDMKPSKCTIKKTFADKGVQLVTKTKKQKTCMESSDIQTSSELPTTSTDSTTCKVLNRIRKECEKYHQKKCKSGHKKCEESSTTTTVNCERCNRQHHCSCRLKCKVHKTKSVGDKSKKKCVAYNLIIQTSDSVVSEETARDDNYRQLQDIIVKVPPRSKQLSKAPFKEVSAKIEKKLPQCSPQRDCKVFRSRSLPNDSEMSSEDFGRKMRTCTVRDYLEMNRPDFVERSTKRQTCLKLTNQTRPDEICHSSGYKMIVVHSPECSGGNYVGPCNTICTGVPLNYNQCANPFTQLNCSEVTGVEFDWGGTPALTDILTPSSSVQALLCSTLKGNDASVITGTNERANKRKLLSQQLDRQQTLNALSSAEIHKLAKELGAQLGRKKIEPKFVSEHEMKKHSEKIYKSLPEVVKKREDLKKENVKKTNLLMANIFKKNLQKKTLCGSVNLSNYSTVLKI